MFGFVKRLLLRCEPERQRVEPPPPTASQQRFRQLAAEMWERHHLDDDAYDNLLYSMASIEHELNQVGGGNWNSGDYGECLGTVTEILSSAEEFTPEQVTEIQRCADEIASCGRELLEQGASSREITAEIDYLVARSVDWCCAHPKAKEDDT